MKKNIIILLVLLSTSCSAQNSRHENKDLIMWYNSPAKSWMTEALPVGNGYIGSMFFGDVPEEKIQFTEGSLWTGGPDSYNGYNFGNNNPQAYKYLPELRSLIRQGKFDEANNLAENKITSKIHYARPNQYYGEFGAQQTLGTYIINITSDNARKISDYKRGIDLNTGHGFVEYTSDGIKYSRTYFGDYPDRIMVYRFESSKPSSYTIVLSTPHFTSSFKKIGNIVNKSGYLEDNQMKFQIEGRIDTDGQLNCSGDTIYIFNALYFNFLNSVVTSYKGEFPTYTGVNPVNVCSSIMSNIAKKDYKHILQTQLDDYCNLFCKVEIELGEGNNEKPIDVRLAEYSKGTNDPGFEELYFQYGRYLMISGSRKGTLPLNLQGKWNNSTTPPWSCDYHTNINLQMLYWPAEITNLEDCISPLIDYIPSLVKPGRITAHDFFNAKGWTVNTINNPFGFTAVGEHMPWAFFPAGGAWLCRHLWEHYLYIRNIEYLQDTALPVMKEAARFWMDYLVTDENGYLISSPSFSPEHGGISGGTTMDHQIVRDLFTNCVSAYNELNLHDSFIDSINNMLPKIFPDKIGRWGQLQEWKEDIDQVDDHHRHVSHLYGLFPGNEISPEATPELAKAAEMSLNSRGDGGTGWSLAWKINFWARLENGNHAYVMLHNLLRPVDTTQTAFEGGSYNNLLCAHPPFQLDGNMGATSGIAEMLFNPVSEKPLPACPYKWKNGYIKGLKSQKGNTVDIYWKNGKMTKFNKHS